MKVCNKRLAAVIISVFAVCTAICIIMSVFLNDANTAEIISDGSVMYELDLNKSETLHIPSPNGGENVVKTENGVIYISEATCPDKLCVRQGKRGLGCSNTTPIVCLPNKLIISVKNSDTVSETEMN